MENMSAAACVSRIESAVIPWDFGPPTGRGMKATRKLEKGDVAFRVPLSLLVTPRKCRDLLFRLCKHLVGTLDGSEGRRFTNLADASVGLVAQVVDDEGEVLAACRGCGIDPSNDDLRKRLLGTVMLVVSTDDSDDTVELRKLSEPEGDTVWFAVTALQKPSLRAAIDAIPDESALVTGLLAARSWRDSGSDYYIEAESECCVGLGLLIQEQPAEVGLYAEWSDEELRGLEGSLHAATARRYRNDVSSARSLVRAALVGAVAELGDGSIAPTPWGTEESFTWAWVRVASRHRKAGFTSLGADEGKTVMIPGGADIFNHNMQLPPGHSTRESADGQFVEILAQENYQEGDEVFISYGAMPNSELLLGYGFAIEGNPHDRVELVITLDQLDLSKTESLRPELCLLAISCRAELPSDMADQSVDCELLPARSDADKREVRVALSLHDPLLGALLGLSRLERLLDNELALLDKGLGREELRLRLRTGQSLEPRSPSVAKGNTADDLAADIADIDLACVALRCEMRALGALRALFEAMLAQYPAEPPPPGDGPHSAGRAACCRALCSSEKSILRAALGRVEDLLAANIRLVLETARRLGGSGCSGDRVKQYFAIKRESVQASAADTVKLFQQLGSLPPRCVVQTTVIWTQIASFFFMLVHGVLNHELADQIVPDVLDCWSPAVASDDACRAASTPIARKPRDYAAWGLARSDASGSGVQDYLSLFRTKTEMWGRYLFAQFLSAGALNAQSMSEMAMESVDIRKRYAWSVPSPEALDLLAAEAPLVEIGAGLGLWAGLLRDRGVDIRAFDLGAWDASFAPNDAQLATGDGLDGTAGCLGAVERGGPESLHGIGASCNTLVLMWPDYEGVGSFGLDCAQRWAMEENGRKLICIGEWRGSTLGAFAPGLPPHGQSFSEDCQRFVEENFRLVQSLALPNWPLFLDGVRVFERL